MHQSLRMNRLTNTCYSLKYADHVSEQDLFNINSGYVELLIEKLRHNVSPGIEGITDEDLILVYRKCEKLCDILATLCSTVTPDTCLPR